MENISNSLKIQRNVKVGMLAMDWFFNDRKNFVAFCQILKDMPSKVYDSELVKSLLHVYWDETQKEILYKLFIPYCIGTILTILYFTTMLNDKQESQNEDDDSYLSQKVFLSLLIFPFWLNSTRNEFKQLKALRVDYFKSMWNVVDVANITLTALVIVTSFKPLAFYSSETNKVIASIASCLLTFKVFDWLRLFENTAFFILLVRQTLIDIGSFLILIIFAWLTFGLPMVILNLNRDINDDES